MGTWRENVMYVHAEAPCSGSIILFDRKEVFLENNCKFAFAHNKCHKQIKLPNQLYTCGLLSSIPSDSVPWVASTSKSYCYQPQCLAV